MQSRKIALFDGTANMFGSFEWRMPRLIGPTPQDPLAYCKRLYAINPRIAVPRDMR